jgi:hypothetical protein
LVWEGCDTKLGSKGSPFQGQIDLCPYSSKKAPTSCKTSSSQFCCGKGIDLHFGVARASDYARRTGEADRAWLLFDQQILPLARLPPSILLYLPKCVISLQLMDALT